MYLNQTENVRDNIRKLTTIIILESNLSNYSFHRTGFIYCSINIIFCARFGIADNHLFANNPIINHPGKLKMARPLLGRQPVTKLGDATTTNNKKNGKKRTFAQQLYHRRIKNGKEIELYARRINLYTNGTRAK